MSRINKTIEKNIQKIILAFIYMQPILDLTAGITQNVLKLNITFSSIIRLLFLLFCLYYIFVLNKTENKKKSMILTSIIGIYMLIFSLITVKYKDIHAISYELKNTINTFYFPILLISFKDMFKQYKININIKQLVLTYMTYIILILIPNITHTGFKSYAISKLGTSGWFTSANAAGNILSILLPIIILYILENKKYVISITMIISILYVFATMGTKVPVLSLGICALTTLLFYIIKWIKEKQNKKLTIAATSTVLITIMSFLIIPKTTFYKNIQIHKEYLGFESYTEILTNPKLFDHFVFSERLSFLNHTQKNYTEASISEKLFGIGYIENYGTDEASTKTIEIDYFEVLYRNGIIGFIIFFSIFMTNIKIKKQNTLENIETNTSIALILLLALFSGHILITPAVSIFVALILIKGGTYEKTNKK